MPGMMDTVLNVGLNDRIVKALAAKAGDRFAWDSYRRFLQMFGCAVVGLESSAFDDELRAVKVGPAFSVIPDEVLLAYV